MTAWAQRNVALHRAGGDPRPAAHRLFATLAPLVDDLRRRGVLDRFTFQRKPPDVRLRFGADDPPDLVAVDGALDDLVAGGVLDRWAPAPYEPEVRKLGGPGASAALHRHADADTAAWLAFELTGAGRPPLEPALLAVVAADDLFVRVLRDRDEVWDTWANLADLVPPAEPGSADAVRTGLDAAAATAGPLAGPDASRVPGPLRALATAHPGPVAGALAALAEDHDRTAGDLAAELDAGRLRVGPRAILPFVAQLDLQRWGLGGPQQAAVAAAMMAAWDPTTGLRGR